MVRLPHVCLAALLIACGNSTGGTDDPGEGEVYPSTYESGKHRATMLSLDPEGDGLDLDGDGEIDNNLPFVLESADGILSSLDLSPDGINLQIASSIEAESLNLLMDSSYASGTLTIDVLTGDSDGSGNFSVSPSSFDADGKPNTSMSGEFADQTTFMATADSAIIIIPFTEDTEPAPVPIERVTLAGTMTADTVDARLTGVIPSDSLADDVIANLVPEEGVGSLSKESILSLVRGLAARDNISDIDLGNGKRGVSASFTVQATASTWTE